jgi:hypothetical protein
MERLMEKELRKRQSHLTQAGTGVMLFAAWRVISINLYLGFGMIPVEMIREAAAEFGLNEKFFLIFMAALVAGVLLWQLSIRMYIGLSATAEGKGKTKGWLYLAVTGLVIAAELQIAWEAFDIERILAGEALEIHAIISAIISFIMELASAYVLLELLISGICVKLLRKKMKA